MFGHDRDGAGGPGSASVATRALVRRAHIGDRDAIAALEQRCFTSPWPAAAFSMAIRDPFMLALVADVGAVVVGYVIACAGTRELLIANLAVAPRQRRRGVARRLLDAAIDWGRARGLGFCVLDVRESNTAAIRLYRRAGFDVLGRKPRYYSSPQEDALSMGCRIARRTIRPPGAAAS